MNKLGYFIDLANQVFEDPAVRAQIERFQEIDDAMDCVWELPDALKKVSWMQGRKFVSTAPADAVNAATRAFADREPNISVQPFSSMPEEYARVERIETALKWELENMNAKGKQTVHWKIVHSAMRYCKVALQTEYLPYMFKNREKDNYIKAVLAASKFNWRVHHPSTVFSQDGPYGLPEFVVSRTKRSVNWLVSKFGKDNKGVVKMLAKMSDKQDLADQLKQTVWYYDVTTWNDRATWASFTEMNTVDSKVSDGFEFMREEHKTPFLNWVVVDNMDPILKSVIDADLWKNNNVIRTMAFAKAVDMVEQPQLWIKTLSGDLQDVNRAEGGVNEPLVTSQTTQVTQLRPPQLDPQIEEIKQMSESEIFRTSVAQILASVQEIGRTATYSTVNAMLQAALTQLVLAKNAAERAETLAFKQSLHWIDYSKIPLRLYRTSNKTVGDTTYGRGQEIILVESMDEEKMAQIPEDRRNTITPVSNPIYMSVTLQPKSITDKQTEQTMAINAVERLGASYAMTYDDYGFGDYSQHEQRRGIEDLTKADVEAEKQRLLMAPQEEAQQRQLEQQMAIQQEQQVAAENARLEQQNAAFAGQKGFDFRGGGPPAAVPGQGREQLTGQTFAGEELA